ncbi:symplekin-like [Babylonia areolata]|uniref:symplekin-like n=1 Tax=Babylonia areolata TaxID=304850 RepID=UPI003FCF5469
MAGASTSATAPPKRMSTAAQFFTDDEDAELAAEIARKSTNEKVVDLLNQASLLPNDSDKVSNLRQVQELIIHKDPELLDNFLDEVIAFQSDRSVDVRKCIIGFMEEACKKDHTCLPRVMPCIMHLVQDENVNVQKKVILAFSGLYRCALQWVGKAKTVTPEMNVVWEQVNKIKSGLLELIDSDNDGVRTHVVKMLEGLTLTLSKRTPDCDVPKKQIEFSLDQLTDNNRLVRVKKLEAEGQNMFLSLVQFQGSPHISSINLMTVMGAVTNIARQRTSFFDQVVQSFEALHVNLPPTLAKSQVSSVRKNLKMQMLSLLRHSASADFIPQITTLLTDLGASQSEINKAMPKEEGRKRKIEEPGPSSKKAKIETVVPEVEADDYDDIGMTPWVDRTGKKTPTATQRQTAIDITAEDLLPRLSVQHVADLVLLSMVMLPDTMPAQFQSTYTPIAAAGTDSQIKHVSRLLATQLTMAGMGKGVGELKLQAMKKTELPDPSATPAYDDGGTSPKQLIQTVVGMTTAEPEDDPFEKARKAAAEFMAPPSAPAPRKGLRQFKLESVTKPLKSDTLDAMTVSIFDRILLADKMAAANHIQAARNKILVSLTSQFGGRLRDILLEHIFSDLRNRYDLAFSWLYQEYVNCQGFNMTLTPGKSPDLSSYDECLTRLLKAVSEMPDQKDGLFHRLILEAPIITDNAMQMVRRYCFLADRTEAGMKTLRSLIVMRSKYRLGFLDIMLTFTASDRPEIRTPAIQTAQNLYENAQLKPNIEVYAIRQLKMLLAEKPVIDNKNWMGAFPGENEGWNEETIKAHLYLYLGLLPSNHALIHELANVYTATSADIKRTILRVLEPPVKGMGMDSPELLTLVENCPKGSETLVMRVIHILTDKAVPSPELVDRIRDLYHKRVPDVRFLIPVLNGLSKKEVISALPKLIKLKPMVVKEVFNRLMGAHISASASYVSPLTPDELLVALHNIDPNKCDMKTIIKAANLCFSERNIYTEEVLAIVMQQLMDQTPLPTLLMRTVIQSLSMYPRLLGFVLNILHRLIIKQVWHQSKVWEGFIKCCQRTKPQSFQVLLQLPAQQLTSVFRVSPDLRLPLLSHVKSFSQHQLAHIHPDVMHVLETEPEPEKKGDSMEQTPQGEPLPPGTSGPPPVVKELTAPAQPISGIQTISTLTADRRPPAPWHFGETAPAESDVHITGETIVNKPEPPSSPPEGTTDSGVGGKSPRSNLSEVASKTPGRSPKSSDPPSVGKASSVSVLKEIKMESASEATADKEAAASSRSSSHKASPASSPSEPGKSLSSSKQKGSSEVEASEREKPPSKEPEGDQAAEDDADSSRRRSSRSKPPSGPARRSSRKR